MSHRTLFLLLLTPLLSACTTHPIQHRPSEPLVAAPVADGELVVLRFEDETDGTFLDGFWLDSCEDPVGELSQLYAKHLESTGLFRAVRYVNTTDREVALAQSDEAAFVLSGQVTYFTSQMHAHLVAFFLPTSVLTAFGIPGAPCWSACDIRARYTLSDAAGRTRLVSELPLEGRGRQSLFFATYWTEGFVFQDTIDQAANETAQALGHGLLQRLTTAPASSLPTSSSR